MTKEERTYKLRAAVNLIIQVRDSFSNEKKTCDHCGMVTFPAWNDKQMRDQLNGAITRLQKVEERMLRADLQEPPEEEEQT